MNRKKLAISLAFAMLLAMSMSYALTLEDVRNFFGVTVRTDTPAQEGVYLYDKYAQVFDFFIFSGIFVAICMVAFKKFWGEDFEKAGAGRAIKALAIVLGGAFALAAIKAGMSVTFFVPFVKNVFFFILVVLLYLLFQKLGVKSKILSWILAVIVAILIWNATEIFMDKNKGLKFGGIGGIGGIPDFGGPTKIVSDATEGVGNFFSNMFSGIGGSGSGTSTDKKPDETKAEDSTFRALMDKYRQRAYYECGAQIAPEDTDEQALKKLRDRLQVFENFLKLPPPELQDEVESTRRMYQRCMGIYTQWEKALRENLVAEDYVSTMSDGSINQEIKAAVYLIYRDCEIIKFPISDTYGSVRDKLTAKVQYYRNAQMGWHIEEQQKQFFEDQYGGSTFKNLEICEEYLSRLNRFLIQNPGWANEVINLDPKNAENSAFKLTCSIDIKDTATAEDYYNAYMIEVKEMKEKVQREFAFNMPENLAEISKCEQEMNKWKLEAEKKGLKLDQAGARCITDENRNYVMGLSVKQRLAILREFQQMYDSKNADCPASVYPNGGLGRK